MMFKTHLVFSLFIGLSLIKFINIENKILFFVFLLFFSVFPDIDLGTSKIGQRMKFISLPIEFIFKHRGFFHSVYLPVSLFLLFILINQFILGLSILIGYLSHLFLDAFTYAGVRLLNPIFSFKVSGFSQTGKLFDYMLFLIFLLADFYFLIEYMI